ncbi:MAG: riboflavin kinase [Oscillibacter sp.]
MPSHGVYATRATLEDGSCYAAVTNVGTRPTVQNGSDITVEACLLDFRGPGTVNSCGWSFMSICAGGALRLPGRPAGPDPVGCRRHPDPFRRQVPTFPAL